MVLEGGAETPLLEKPFQSSSCCLVQGHEAALAKFGAPNHQAIWSDVVQSQVGRFGHAQARARHQGEQGTVGCSTEWTPRV